MVIQNLIEHFRVLYEQFRPQDIIDIVLVWFVVYRILILTKRSGAVQILSGIGILAILYILSIRFELLTFNTILEKFFSNLFLIVVILFQGEIRRALAQIGSNPFFLSIGATEEAHIVDEISKAAVNLAQNGRGALIVIERDIALDYFVEVGTEMDAVIKAETILTIFQPTSPLHDGAIIVRNDRISSAGCFLPLSKNPALDRNLGTRHRAALGLAEETDAYIIVVSEELKSVSWVHGGQLVSDLGHKELRQKLFEVYGVKSSNEALGAAT